MTYSSGSEKNPRFSQPLQLSNSVTDEIKKMSSLVQKSCIQASSSLLGSLSIHVTSAVRDLSVIFKSNHSCEKHKQDFPVLLLSPKEFCKDTIST